MSVGFILLTGSVSCTDPISVFAPPNRVQDVATLSITPAEVHSLALGQFATLEAIARDAKGAVLPSVPIDWIASDPEVVRLRRPSGYSGSLSVVGLRAGVTTLTAKSGQGSASIVIAVHAPGPVMTVVILSETRLTLGKRMQLNVVQRDSDNVVLTAPLPTFSSSDSAIARVSATGLVTAVAEGIATLTATSGGKSGSRAITVIAAEHGFIWTAETGMIDVGTLPGFVSSRAEAVSSAGHVAGSLFSAGDSLSHAFVRAPGARGELRDLGGLSDGGSSAAFGVNNTGQVVGYARTATGGPHAVLWRANGALVDLGALTGGNSMALGINDSGQVVGWSVTGAQIQPFVWTEGGGMRIIAGTRRGTAFAVNNSGLVAGDIENHPVSWNAVAFPSALPLLSGDTHGRALGISNAGETVGYSNGCSDAYYVYDDDCEGAEHPVLWTTSNVPTDLRRIASARIASAVGINTAHQIVGSNDNQRAILWSATNGLRDLGVLPGRQWSGATAINDAGVVVGWSSNP